VTERRLFEQRLKANEALLRAVTDSVPDRLLMLDLQLRIQFVNRAILDIHPEDLVNRNALDLLPESEREAALAVFQRVIASRAPHVHEYREIVQGEVRWFENRVGPVIEDGRIVGLTVASSEITTRRRGEEAMHTQARILDTMREGVLVLDAAHTIKVVNNAMARLTGYDARDLVGRHNRVLSRHTVAEYAALDAGFQRRLLAEGFCEFEFECVRRDGSSFMAAVVLTPIEIAGERHTLGVIEDITQRRVLEREIIEIANREQRRIGNDLHDGLGQELTGIALMLRGLTARLRKLGSAAAGEAEEIVALVNKAIESTRQLARGLSPVSIERGGLTFALRSLAGHATDLYGCNVRFRSKVWPQLTLDASACNHLYRIAQEAVTNAVRHGHATEVTIDLQAAGEDVQLRVSDNGRGLPAGVELALGLGLKIMRYRANIVGGTVNLEARPEGGVQVTLGCRQPASIETQPASQGVTP
jgi:two-component system, LuxR family, sensor kinase FixL